MAFSKEGKHLWHLWRFPKRTQAAVMVHCFFPLLVMGRCPAFRWWRAVLGGEGTARWRQRLRQENQDKIIVFIGHAYGISHLAAFAILTHLPLRRLPSSLGSPQAILQRFGISP